MQYHAVFGSRKTIPANPAGMLKVTALLYLKEALLEEAYEGCAEFVQTAKDAGARQSEVRAVIIGYNRGPRGWRENEANQEKKSPRRF